MTTTTSTIPGLTGRLSECSVVPVVAIDDAARAPALGRALLDGGLPIVEVTFRTAAAEDAIRALRENEPEVLVGAGTVLTPATVDRAVEAGASFVVTPGFSPTVVERCLERDIPVVPGVNTPSLVEQALALGLTTLKFFPAVPSGGIPMLRALAGPYPDVRFMPTGGITAASAPEWLAVPTVVAVGGTWIATADDIAAGHFTRISDNARAAAQFRAAASPARPSQKDPLP